MSTLLYPCLLISLNRFHQQPVNLFFMSDMSHGMDGTDTSSYTGWNKDDDGGKHTECPDPRDLTDNLHLKLRKRVRDKR